MYVDRKVTSLLARECNEVFDCRRVVDEGNLKLNCNFFLRKSKVEHQHFSEINS
jgi:hypothetical protein